MEIVAKDQVNKLLEKKSTEKIEHDSQPITVKLEWYEVSVAVHIAGLRHTESMRQGLKDRFGYQGRDLHDNLYGVLGEIAFAKSTDSYFPMSVNTYKGADVGWNWQVRTVGSNKNRDLIIRPKDKDSHYYVLVEVIRKESYTCLIHGWIQGIVGKKEEFLTDFGYSDRPKVFRIPQNRLTNPRQMPI